MLFTELVTAPAVMDHPAERLRLLCALMADERLHPHDRQIVEQMVERRERAFLAARWVAANEAGNDHHN